jgi:hypothetical protein
MIHRQPKGDVTPAIVTGYGKPLVTERTHHLDAVAGHYALGVRLVIGGCHRFGRATVATQIGTDHRVVADEQRRYPVPCGVGTGVTVE